MTVRPANSSGAQVHLQSEYCRLRNSRAVRHPLEKAVVLLHNGWWVTQETLTHPTYALK